MPLIHLETFIKAPPELCFDLARSVDVHMASTNHTGERAIGGITSGMMNLGDEVTWEGTHFRIRQHLTSRITAFDRPRMFVDEMQRGAFKHWRHTHLFEEQDDGTLMIDDADYASPLGLLGRIFDKLLLESHMTRLLITRNNHIKKVAEERARLMAREGVAGGVPDKLTR
ncbi:MAG TPA: SRPBCC family protein [Pyrinomonadaceae bacterium]|jgi:ligand-binding SRPBCC domain-containing protein